MVSSELLLQVGLLNRVIVLTFDSFVAHICVYRIFAILSKLIHEQKILKHCFNMLYCFRCGNVAAILELDEHLDRDFTIFEAAPQVNCLSANLLTFWDYIIYLTTQYQELVFFRAPLLCSYSKHHISWICINYWKKHMKLDTNLFYFDCRSQEVYHPKSHSQTTSYRTYT